MRVTVLLAITRLLVLADEPTAEPRSGIAFAQRLVDTLPRLPNVIQSQMEGKPEKLREMISHMLGDGLISQLVVDPLGVAEGMGVPLSSLGINKSAVQQKFDFRPNATLGDKLFHNQKLSLLSLVTATPSTTEKVMYLDGVPIKDFDQFVRNRNLEGHFSTKSPISTTTSIPSANDIAAAVLDKIKMSLPYSQQVAPTMAERPATNDNNLHKLNKNMIDPRRIQEVDTLLRRTPQNFDALERAVGSVPSSFVQSLDPEVNEVVTSLRTGNVMDVESVRQLQNILQTYEQSLQTKELIAKRKQLQLLQSELVEQRKRIEEQKRMEEELKKKEQDLEEQRKNMEVQLKKQLHMWHNSFGVSKEPLSPLDFSNLNENVKQNTLVAELPNEKESVMAIGSPSYELTETDLSTSRMQKSFPIFSEVNQEKQQSKHRISQLWPTDLANVADKNVQYLERRYTASEPEEEPEEMTSSCSCQAVSLQKMKGKWAMTLASKSLIKKMDLRIKQILQNVSNSHLSCSTLTMSTPKVSAVAQDAPITWEFRTTTSPKLYRLTGSALSLDHKLVQLQMSDLSNDIFSIPLCVLKSSSDSIYDYMVVTNANGPCNEAALVVRNPDKFFDEKNNELVMFLKHKIAKEEINDMDIVPFANVCS